MGGSWQGLGQNGAWEGWQGTGNNRNGTLMYQIDKGLVACCHSFYLFLL
jgi:hypothetical protein